MSMPNSRSNLAFVLIGGLVCAVLAVTLFPLAAGASSPGMPPRPVPGLPSRPTPGPEPEPSPEPEQKPGPVGALIELRVQFDQAWSWADNPWPEMETIVQWQDGLGEWHDVEGWRGGFDEVTGYEGRKSWWMPKEHLGAGPFRWAVYLERGGALLVLSESFYTPRSAGQVLRVVVSPSP